VGAEAGGKMPVRIVHTITKLEFGGAQQNTLYTLNHLPEDYEGYLICGEGGRLDQEVKNPEKFNIEFCPFLKREINLKNDWRAYKWMVGKFKKIKPDIVHSHSSKAGILSRWAAKEAGVPVIIHTFHGFGFTPLQPWFVRKFFIFLEQMAAKKSTRLIFVSHANRDQAKELNIGKEKKYEVIRSGIGIEKFVPTQKHEYLGRKDPLRTLGIELKDEDKVVGNVSCFKPQKCLHDYIEACRRLKDKGNYKFVLIGDGKLRPELEKQVEEAGLKGFFDMQQSWSEDIHRMIPEFDIMLHTACFEGLPRVFLEAMASEVPIVATNVDGATDVIEHDVNGYLAEPGDIDELVKFSYKLLENKELRDKMGLAGKNKLKSEFDIKTMSEMLNKLYRELIEESG